MHFVPGARLTWVLSGVVTHAQCVSQGHICSASGIWKFSCQIIYILSVYSPFSDRVGLPLHNIHIPSPFTSIMDIFFVDLKFGHICFYTLFL